MRIDRMTYTYHPLHLAQGLAFCNLAEELLKEPGGKLKDINIHKFHSYMGTMVLRGFGLVYKIKPFLDAPLQLCFHLFQCLPFKAVQWTKRKNLLSSSSPKLNLASEERKLCHL